MIGKMKNQKVSRFICTVPNILSNTVIVTFVCIVCYTAAEARHPSLIPFYASTVALGEIISSGILGTLLLLVSGKTVKRTINNI